MKVLVTGGAGYIGSILVRRLLEARHEVVVLDRLAFGDEPLRELAGRPDLRLVAGDIRDRDLVASLVRDREAVVHLAAIVGEAACAADPKLAIETNFEATRHLAEASVAAGIARFVFASTCSVYGAGRASRLSEESELAPAELYAETRVNAERALTEVARGGFRPTVLRFGTVYGYSPRTRFDLWSTCSRPGRFATTPSRSSAASSGARSSTWPTWRVPSTPRSRPTSAAWAARRSTWATTARTTR